MIDLNKEIQCLLRSIHSLNEHLDSLPKHLKDSETAQVARELIESAEEKVVFLMEQNKGRL